MARIAPHPTAPAALAALADANFVVHAGWVQRRVPGMHVSEDEGLVLVDAGLPCDTFNLVCRARLAAEGARTRVREALAYFAGVARPFSWWVGPGDAPEDLGTLLVEAGLHRAEAEVAMAADLAALRLPDLAPEGLQVVRVRTGAALRDFAQVNAENWTPPDPQVLRFYDLAAPFLLDEDAPLRLYVGYLGDGAVAAAECTVGGGVAGLYNIATRAAYRRRGFGSALTVAPLLEAREEGLRTAVLQASADGVGVYERAGFVPFGAITEYKPGAAS